MKKSIIILGILLFFGISSVFSQTGIIRGFVYDKSNGEPMIFTSVYLEGTTYGIATDVNGYFNLSKVEPGNYSLLVSFVGYDTARMAVEVLPNRIQSKTIYMEESSIKLEEFTVSAERQEMKTDVYTSIVKITPKQLTKIPTIGSEPDLAQYLQVLPGVIFTGDQGGKKR
jgi:carboxypeptidase-like protein